MKAGRTKRVIAGLAATIAVGAAMAPQASGASLPRQALCDPEAGYAQPNQVGALLPFACENGDYNPETESYEPYDPATDDDGLIGLNNTLGRDVLGL